MAREIRAQDESRPHRAQLLAWFAAVIGVVWAIGWAIFTYGPATPNGPAPTPCVQKVTEEQKVQRQATKGPGGNGYGDWANSGGDGQGGNLMSYHLKVDDAKITDAKIIRDTGFGSWTWWCGPQEPRCPGHQRLEDNGDGTWTAWAATNDSTSATAYFELTISRRVDVPCA